MTDNSLMTYNWMWSATQGLQPRNDNMWSPNTDGVGLGVFETLRTHSGHPVLLEAHLDRLVQSLELLGWVEFAARSIFRETVRALVNEQASSDAPCRIRLSVSPAATDDGSLVIRVTVGPLALHTGPATVWLSPYVRNPQSPLAGVKSASFGENVIALAEATAAGYDEAIFTNTEGNPVEGSMSNIFFVHNETLVTPPLSTGCLAGITRAATIERAHSLGIEVDERVIALDELKSVNEIFLTSTTRLQQSVVRVDVDNPTESVTLWSATASNKVAAQLRARQ